MKLVAVWTGSLLLVLAVLGIGGALAWVKYQQIVASQSAGPPPEMPIEVNIQPVRNLGFRNRTTVIGTVLSPQSIMLSNEVAGTVTAVNFRSGELVSLGQELITLDNSVELAQLARSEAKAKIAKSTNDRASQAARANAVTIAEVEEAQAQLQQAEAEILELKAVIARKILRAPFAGRIGLSNTHLGQFLPSGSQIASLQSVEGFVYIDFMIPQSAADYVGVGQAVQLAIGERAVVTAKIDALDSRADKLSRNIMGRARLEPVPPQLVPGDSVKVTIEFGPRVETVAVPAESVRRAPMKTFVFAAELDHENKLRANPKDIVLGPSVDGTVSVLSGLLSTDRVVVDGSFKLRPGVLIAPHQPSGVTPVSVTGAGH